MSQSKCYTFYVENKSNQYKKNIDIINEIIKNSDKDIIARHINPSEFISLEDDLSFAKYGYIEVGETEVVFFDGAGICSEIYTLDNTNSEKKELEFKINGISTTPVMKCYNIFKLNDDVSLMANIPSGCAFAIHIWLMSKYKPV